MQTLTASPATHAPQSVPLSPLPLPVPPTLETALGYEAGPGDHAPRYFALYWMPGGDEAMLEDGQSAYTGHWPAHLAFIEHPTVAPHLRPYFLGDSETPPKHWLIIDRHARTASIAPAKQAYRFLQDQHLASFEESDPWQALTPTEQAQVLTNIRTALRTSLAHYQPPALETVLEQMAAEERHTAEMVAWLDAQGETL